MPPKSATANKAS